MFGWAAVRGGRWLCPGCSAGTMYASGFGAIWARVSLGVPSARVLRVERQADFPSAVLIVTLN